MTHPRPTIAQGGIAEADERQVRSHQKAEMLTG